MTSSLFQQLFLSFCSCHRDPIFLSLPL